MGLCILVGTRFDIWTEEKKSFQNYIAGSDSGSNKEVIDQMILIDSSSGKTSRPWSPSVPCPPSARLPSTLLPGIQ